MKENETNQSLEECCLERLKHCSSMEEAINIVEFYKEQEKLFAPLREFFLREFSNKNER